LNTPRASLPWWTSSSLVSPLKRVPLLTATWSLRWSVWLGLSSLSVGLFEVEPLTQHSAPSLFCWGFCLPLFLICQNVMLGLVSELN
jgi:hypothetical protein